MTVNSSYPQLISGVNYDPGFSQGFSVPSGFGLTIPQMILTVFNIDKQSQFSLSLYNHDLSEMPYVFTTKIHSTKSSEFIWETSDFKKISFVQDNNCCIDQVPIPGANNACVLPFENTSTNINLSFDIPGTNTFVQTPTDNGSVDLSAYYTKIETDSRYYTKYH